MAFKVKNKITLPQFKFQVDVARYFKIAAAIYLGKEMKPAEGKKPMEPAHLAKVTDLESGELGEIIVPAVLKSTLEEAFPEATYVGKCFAITKQKRQEGKRYDKFSVDEIEDPESGSEENKVASPPTGIGAGIARQRAASK